MLGPPICLTCVVMLEYYPNIINPKKQGEWRCKFCGGNKTDHLLTSPYTMEMLEDNETFLNFIYGKDAS